MMSTDVQFSEEDILVDVGLSEIHQARFDEGELLQSLKSLYVGEFAEFKYAVGDEAVLPLAINHL
jgi:hypothetical protein